MVVEINAYAPDGDATEMWLSGLAYPEDIGTELETVQYNTTASSETFIATTDKGYIEIWNHNSSNALAINYIKVSSEMFFKFGNETYTEPNIAFRNDLLNGTDGTDFAYTHVNTITADMVTDMTTDGYANLKTGGTLGQYDVTVVGTDDADNLAGKVGIYRVNVVTLTFDENVNKTIKSDPWEFNLKELITSVGAASGISADAVKNEVVFSISPNPNATLSGTKGNQTLKIEGVASVTVTATLGNIKKTFTVSVQGAAFDIAAPYVYSNKSTYTFKAVGDFTKVKKFKFTFDKNGITGELAADKDDITLKPNDVDANDNETELTITGIPIGKGGTIPVFATYDYQVDALTTLTGQKLEGVLTVAYQKHIWNFESNLIPTLRYWYADKTTETKEGKWKDGKSTFDPPTDRTDNALGAVGKFDDNNDWRFVRKMSDVHKESAIIYYYNHNVTGTNSLVIPESEGLIINTTKGGEQLGVEMASTRYKPRESQTYTDDEGKTVNVTYADGWAQANVYSNPNDESTRIDELVVDTVKAAGNGKVVNKTLYLDEASDKKYKCSNLMMKLGGQLIIPKVKPGQWIEFRWTRHVADRGERLQMENLLDAAGTYISQVYKIGNTFYNIPGNTSTYMFQVAPAGTEKTDGISPISAETVATDDDDCVDAIFTIADNVYVSIQQIELHEPGWEYKSSMYETLIEGETSMTTATPIEDYPKLTSTYLDNGAEQLIPIAMEWAQNAPNAPSHWQVDLEGDSLLKVEPVGTTAKDNDNRDKPGFYEAYNQPFSLKYKGGWGKAYLTLNCYTSNQKYVANHKTWVFTFGAAPKQTYPYTWDFTKYFKGTKASVGGTDDDYDSDNDEDYEPIGKDGYDSITNPKGSREFHHTANTWKQTGKIEEVVTTDYDTFNYQSYFVDGAQLVSHKLGLLPETEGLGFSIANKASGGLKLDMQSTVSDGSDDDDDDGDVSDPAPARAAGATPPRRKASSTTGTWRDGGLTITGGGKITVPAPGTSYAGYYIYIRSSVKPTSVSNTTERNDDDDVKAADHQYKYNFSANADAVIDFSGDVTVYAIGVTNIMKTMHTVGQIGWATESRDHEIDHALTGYLTQNDANAYTVTYDSYDLKSATIALSAVDEGGYLPASDGTDHGVVLMQDEKATANGTYQVPLFYPAITTSPTTSTTTFGASNLMKANLTETLHTTEEDGDSTKFILTNVHYRFTSTGENADEEKDEKKLVEADAAGFYRLHIFTQDTEDDTGDITNTTTKDKNTMAANTAYLCVPTAQLPIAVWQQATHTKSRIFIRGLAGAADTPTDLELPQPDGDISTRIADSRGWYTLSGTKLLERPRKPGLYLHDGRKVVVK